MPLTLANRITVIRILCVPVFVLLVLYYQSSAARGEPVDGLRWAALWLFVATVLTDLIDGVAQLGNQKASHP